MSALLAATAVGSVLVAGIFFAFSTFVMGALARLAPSEGVRAMQAINVVVINPWFLGAFLGTALLALASAIAAWFSGSGHPAATIGAALLYIVGCVGVTGTRNVPLNDRLAAVEDPAEYGAVDAQWREYLASWTQWNHVRTAASLAAGVLLVIVLQRR